MNPQNNYPPNNNLPEQGEQPRQAAGAVQPEAQGVPQNAAGQPAENQPQKYTVGQALKDVVSALKVNWKPVAILTVLAGAAGMVMSFIYFFLIMLFVFGIAAGGAGLVAGGASMESITGGIFIVLLVTLLFVLAVQAVGTLFYNAIALALYAGKHGQVSRVGTVLRMGLSRFMKVFLTQVLLGLTILGPIVALALFASAGYAFANLSSGGGPVLNSLFFAANITAIVWIIIALLRYALAPAVALFETEVPVTKTFGRSRHLLVGGGQWFVFKAYLLILVVSIVLSLLTGGAPEAAETSAGFNTGIGNTIYSLLTIAMVPFMVGVLVMLYINRKAVRK